jgi:hypothetical protein
MPRIITGYVREINVTIKIENPNILTISAKTGKIIFATATLDVSSVTVSANTQTMNKIHIGLMLLSPIKALPSMLDNPDD